MLFICKLFVAPVKIIFFFLMSHYFFYSAWTNETVTQNENKPKKKERKKKKKRHCEVLKKILLSLFAKLGGTDKKNIYENYKKK